MRWEWHQQDPNKLHRVFAWLPVCVQKDEFQKQYVWLESVYRRHNVESYGTWHKGSYLHWVYCTREDVVLKRLLLESGEAV